MPLKTRMKEFRVKLSMSQEDLANEVGVRRETIGNLENGKYNPSFKLTYDIAKVLNAPIEVLFWFEE
ncbi:MULTISPECIES: helix-turn-helix transcriptional regulator [Bacillus]|jgi:putative transcriptional regulator|uniref:Helix-turn-helix transcriptional regulator n=2 Tax=Bacillus cereus group TaxID=86661 RepID=A0ABU8HWF7_9BACI|nr:MULTISPECIES: helix-turn-helix domain-containing protein [Bacillus]MBL2121092.1 transcriptional regulator [Klebsiella pneumoniae]MCM0006715.1 helix-turn-helix transcriptional regulator [Bacillus paranthracis]MDV8115703.1 helix-turn-helix transcriptional regulator [Bacillus sp. BAU-SS-2023]CJC62545.1 HTH-type transcriptional regulator [Streptococcus pneumoniae]HDX9505533.1 helix-turn-helix transcriptional regulator [Bacillus thuringiensis]